MKRKNLKNRFLLVLCTILVMSMTIFASGCGNQTKQQESPNSQTNTTEKDTEKDTKKIFEDGAVIGEGNTEFTLVVTNNEDTKTFTVKTDEKTVGAALVKVGLIEGEEGEYGLYVDTVNGVKVDYEKDKTYWAFYINDEYASTSVDATNIEAGATYTLKIEK